MRARMTREFFRPREYQVKLEPKGVQAEIYLVDEKRAVGFGGRRSKPDFNLRFRSVERRNEYIKEYVEKLQNWDSRSAKNRAARNAKGRGLEVGSVLYCSWGYDQTNINYYEVIALVGEKSVRIIPIASKLDSSNPPQDMVKAAKGVPAEFDVLIGADRGWQEKYPDGWLKRAVDGRVAINDHQSASVCDPDKAKYETSFGWGH